MNLDLHIIISADANDHELSINANLYRLPHICQVMPRPLKVRILEEAWRRLLHWWMVLNGSELTIISANKTIPNATQIYR